MKKTEKAAPAIAMEEKAAEGKKEVTKAAAKKAASAEKKAAPAKKAAIKETVYLQYLGKEINKDDLTKQVKNIWTKQYKKKVGELKSIDLYLKPEENAVYYVINGDVTGSFGI